MMDAIEFVKQLRRMNEQGVPKNRFIYPCTGQKTDSPEEVVAEVEEWAKDHPIKTRQSEFLKHYPGARITIDGFLHACPMDVFGDTEISCNVQPCFECRKAFWLAEVEDA
jgi:hypothetical protein